MAYNQERHIELLKRSQNLKNQGKIFFYENQEEDFELSEYQIAVEKHIFWEDRYQVLSLLEDFLNNKIDGEEFCDRVYGLRHKLRRTSEKFKLELISNSETMKNFKPDERSEKLSGFLTSLYCECEHFDEEYESDEFYTSIENGFLNFHQALNEE